MCKTYLREWVDAHMYLLLETPDLVRYVNRLAGMHDYGLLEDDGADDTAPLAFC